MGFDLTVPSSYNVSINTDAILNSKISNKIIENTIVNNWNNITEAIEKDKIKQEQDELHLRQVKNKTLRNMVKHIHWSGNTCIVYWEDGTQTKARWDTQEEFDPEKAILVCMARKLYKNTNIYNEVLKKYAEAGWEHWEKKFLFDNYFE